MLEDNRHGERCLPPAGALIHSLRAFGYDLPTAIADLIDNSIVAKAKNIWVDLVWRGTDSYVAITDDGNGMTPTTLFEAMRPGGVGPLQKRDPHDLGRFGLGLKTASFAHSRKLSVYSKTLKTKVSGRCWDLDYVTKKNDWLLLTCDNLPEIDHKILNRFISLKKGSLILWERLDEVLVGEDMTDSKTGEKLRDVFYDHIKIIERNLGVIFHNFLNGSTKVNLWVGGNLVEAWDPFMTRNKSTQSVVEETLVYRGKDIAITGYVLPHPTRLTKEQYNSGEGLKGWVAQQGFYVYRNRRMLLQGDWLGLGYRHEEHYKLARIRIDLPNDLDFEWAIDVKKSRAKPPGVLRAELQRVANIVRRKAETVFRDREAGILTEKSNKVEIIHLWQIRSMHGRLNVTLNLEHPLVSEAYADAHIKRKIKSLLKLVQETLPISEILKIYGDGEKTIPIPFEADESQVYCIMKKLIVSYVEQNLDFKEIRKRFELIEPFNYYPNLITRVIDELMEA